MCTCMGYTWATLLQARTPTLRVHREAAVKGGRHSAHLAEPCV